MTDILISDLNMTIQKAHPDAVELLKKGVSLYVKIDIKYDADANHEGDVVVAKMLRAELYSNLSGDLEP